MKAAVFEGIGKISLRDRPDIEADPGEAIVKIKYCGICGTDTHFYTGGRKPLEGTVLGHENVGTITQIGQGIDGWKVGERVVVGPPGPCGECYHCRHGHSNICVHALERTNGLAPGIDGGMAEYLRVRHPKDMLHRIPDNVSFEDAVLFDTIAVALRGIRASRFKIGDNVLVTGAGAIGLPAIQLLKIGGARHITVVQRSEKKMEFALRVGADMGFSPSIEVATLNEVVKKLYSGIGPEVVFECAGSPLAFELAVGLVRNGGQVMIIGAGDEAVFSERELMRREVEMKGSLAYTAEDIEICLDYMAKGRFNTEGIVSDIIPLEDIVEKGFNRLLSDRDLIKVLVAP